MKIESIADLVVKKTKQLICLFRFGNIVKHVKREKKLISNRYLVWEKAGATAKTEKVNNTVFEWLKEMEKLIGQEENLKTRAEPEIPNYDCSLAGVFSADHRTRYWMYHEMLDKIKALNTKCEFEPFSTTIPALKHIVSASFVSFEPIKEASDRLLAALHDNNCFIIGLYGKRGFGKTNLVKAARDEDWTMLGKHSGIEDESSSDISNLAQDAAFECEGLPGTIIEVGSSLKCSPVEEWKESLGNLRHSMARWQIFISFRGEDTRYSFTGFLYDALCREGFKTFMDYGGLHIGDQISPSLINAIEASRLSIVVLSENYASSYWCLDELEKILECKISKNQLVWPIFYKVKPSDIRHMRNSYGKYMTEHEQKFGSDSERLQKWKSALFEVSGLSGKAYKIGCVAYFHVL